MELGDENIRNNAFPDGTRALNGPIVSVNAYVANNWVKGFQIKVDHCVCVTTPISMNTVPDFEWTLRSEPSSFPLSYSLDAVTDWPDLDMSVASCYPTWALGTVSTDADWDLNDDEDAAVKIDDADGNPANLVFEDSVYTTAHAITTYPKEYTVGIKVTTGSGWYKSSVSSA